MRTAQIIVALVGILLPYAARLPRGVEWLNQYTGTSINGFLFMQAFNAIALGAIVGFGFMYRRPVSLFFPCLFGFGFLAWAHYSLDLAADAQAAIALMFIPIYALLPIAIGGGIGYLIDKNLNRQDGK